VERALNFFPAAADVGGRETLCSPFWKKVPDQRDALPGDSEGYATGMKEADVLADFRGEAEACLPV
jgi:hypothetical protein